MTLLSNPFTHYMQVIMERHNATSQDTVYTYMYVSIIIKQNASNLEIGSTWLFSLINIWSACCLLSFTIIKKSDIKPNPVLLDLIEGMIVILFFLPYGMFQNQFR